MTLIIRSLFGATLLLTGASAAMAASDTPVAGQSRQTGTSTSVVASNTAPIPNQAVQAGTANNAAVAAQPQKPRNLTFSDNNDPHGGFDPNSAAGARAFFVPQY